MNNKLNNQHRQNTDVLIIEAYTHTNMIKSSNANKAFIWSQVKKVKELEMLQFIFMAL